MYNAEVDAAPRARIDTSTDKALYISPIIVYKEKKNF
tara:strand:- start:572 stop:682 length:111 start_codon:yes stop_codon:yes gene_type:complete